MMIIARHGMHRDHEFELRARTRADPTRFLYRRWLGDFLQLLRYAEITLIISTLTVELEQHIMKVRYDTKYIRQIR